MGNRVARRSTLPFNPSDYEEIRTKPIVDDIGYPASYRLLRHIRTGIEMEYYRLQFNDYAELNDYYEIFEWRLNQYHVVSTSYFIYSHRKEFCSTHYGAQLYVERIPIKLSEIKDIPYPDNLYILLSALEGFHLIYHKIGYFYVQEHMVCINKQGKVKVWLNENLSKKYPESIYTQVDGCYEDMVKRIVAMINYNTDGASQPEPVPSYLKRHVSHPNFNECKMLLKQYARENHVIIPKSFYCILEVLNSDYQRSQMTDSRIYEFEGKKHHEQSVRSHKLKKSFKNSEDSMSQHSFQQDRRKSRMSNQPTKVFYQHPQMMQPIHTQQFSNVRQSTNLIQGPLPVINYGRPIIQHAHYSHVPSVIPPPMLLQPNLQSIRPQFHSVHQPHEIIISQAPSRYNIMDANDDAKSMGSRQYSQKERRLNIYSDDEESQGGSYVRQPYNQNQNQPVKQIALIQHYMPHSGAPLTPTFPYPLSPANIIARPYYLPQQQVILHNNFDSSQRSNKSSKKYYSLSRSRKQRSSYNIDESRSQSKHRRKRNESDSMTDEYYEDDRRKNRKKQQNQHFRKQYHVIDEHDDDDSDDERARRIHKRHLRRMKEEEYYRRFKDEQEHLRKKEYIRRREEYFQLRYEQYAAARRMEYEIAARRYREAEERYSRQKQHDESRRRYEEYLRQKHIEQLEYFKSKEIEQPDRKPHPYRQESNNSGQLVASRSERSSDYLGLANVIHNRQSGTGSMARRQYNYRKYLQEIMAYGEEAPTFVYHSAERYHEIDPYIARDLIALRI